MSLKERLRAIKETAQRAAEETKAEEERLKAEWERRKKDFFANVSAEVGPLIEIARKSRIEDVLRQAQEEIGGFSFESQVNINFTRIVAGSRRKAEMFKGKRELKLTIKDDEHEIEDFGLRQGDYIDFNDLDSCRFDIPTVSFVATWDYYPGHAGSSGGTFEDIWKEFNVTIGGQGHESEIRVTGRKEVSLSESEWSKKEILEDAVLEAILNPTKMAREGYDPGWD